MKLFLSDRDLELCTRLADVRHSKEGQVPDYKEARKKDGWAIHYEGLLGEVAVCNHFNFPVDQHFSAHGDDGAPDLYVGEIPCEVKASTHGGDLTVMLNRLTDFKSDILIQCRVHGRKHRDYSLVTVIGWVSRTDFHERYHVRDFNYGERACYRGVDLKDLSELAAFTTRRQNRPLPPGDARHIAAITNIFYDDENGFAIERDKKAGRVLVDIYDNTDGIWATFRDADGEIMTTQVVAMEDCDTTNEAI